jgi:TrmH family RNA methyltransferase
MIISSPSNQHIKDIRRLRDRKFRQSSHLFYVEGLRLVGEAVQNLAQIEEIIYCPDLLRSDFGDQILKTCKEKNIPLTETSQVVFEALAKKDGPQGLSAVVKQAWIPLMDVKPTGVWVALDSVADPGNLGTILRTLDSTGGMGVILLAQSTDPYDPTAVRASMGSIFSLGIVKASQQQFSQWTQNNDMVVVGTSGSAKEDYQQLSYPADMVLLMGSEREGLSADHYRICDHVARIPMRGRADSLNLAIATAVVLYEIFNQHRPKE